MKEKIKTPLIQEHVADIVILLLAAVFFIIGRFYSIERVAGSSMEPTYYPGDLLIATKSVDPKKIHRGSIVVAEVRRGENKKNICIVKRVAGMPGDMLRVSDGKLYVNGMENVMLPTIDEPGVLSGDYTVPEGMYFLLGDNCNRSSDSRVFGPVAEKNIRSIVIVRVF